MKVLIITDNKFALETSVELKKTFSFIDIAQSPSGGLDNIERLNVKNNVDYLINKYSFIFSIHCKQIFPESLVKNIKCINVHPGFNPHNRGWYPQAFSIINGLKSGVTIHEMDSELDHGPIIIQEEYMIEPWDTSESAYLKIMDIERRMLSSNFERIIRGEYQAHPAESEGNLNLRADFEKLKEFNLKEENTFENFVNRLRALSFSGFNNAYFLTKDGKKVYMAIKLYVDN